MGFTYFLGGTNVAAQALMTATFAGLVALFIFLVMLLEHPFRGAARVGPEPIEAVLAVWKTQP